MEYSIVVPVFNEADKIIASLNQIVGFMRTYASSFEVVIVDDGSIDNSATLVADFAKSNPEVRLIRNPHKGKGPTVWKGVMSADGDLIYMCDADLATPISVLKKMVVWANEQDYDIVIASREGAEARRIGEPFYRHFIGRAFNYWVQILVLPGIKDSQCGFKLFKRRAAIDIFSRLKVYGESAAVLKDAYLGAFDVEVLYLARKLGYKIKALPVEWTYVRTKRLSVVRDSYKMAIDTLKVRLNDLRGLYT